MRGFLYTKKRKAGAIGVLLFSILSLFSFLYFLDTRIEKVYREIFSKELGYTLIGEKPVSMEMGPNDYLDSHPYLTRLFLAHLRRTFYQSKRYIVKTFYDDGGHYTIELIHRPALKTLITSTSQLKRFIETKYRGEANFYKMLENENCTLYTIFSDKYFLGLALGYGKANSHYFCRRCLVGISLYKFFTILPFFSGKTLSIERPNYCYLTIDKPYTTKKVEPSPGFSSLEAEWQWIKQIEWNLEEEREAKPPYSLTLPLYICRHGGDSEVIRDKFKRSGALLANLLSSKSSIREVVAEEATKEDY